MQFAYCLPPTAPLPASRPPKVVKQAVELQTAMEGAPEHQDTPQTDQLDEAVDDEATPSWARSGSGRPPRVDLQADWSFLHPLTAVDTPPPVQQCSIAGRFNPVVGVCGQDGRTVQ